MTLSAGTRLGPYKILSPLGAGGMGEVYRAADTKLGRSVALKVLPDEFAADGSRMARFDREAQVLASLNHPNIATIHGLEESGRARALVMELVEGEDLSQRIARGPIPLEEALLIAKQIAEALEYAHERGIIHRDLKPANIKITPAGSVKVLDFGLAKALESERSSTDMAGSPTLTIAATQPGIVLGTARYMSPEQAKGKPVDRRSDVWAFGAVLYEMLTGKRVFAGGDVSEVIAAVITKDLDLSPLSRTPPRIRDLIGRCLRKDLRNRLAHIADARITLEEYLADPAGATEDVLSKQQTAKLQRRTLPWVLVGLLAGSLLVALWRLWTLEPVPSSPIQLQVQIGEGILIPDLLGALAVLSPDGTTLAYSATAEGARRLYIRSLDKLEATPLGGTEGGRHPFFSPDGQWLAFFNDSAIKKVSLTGGAPLTVVETTDLRGGTWGPDDSIVFASMARDGLYRIPASGGNPLELTRLREKERSHRWPWFLPNGKAVLFVALRQGGP